MKLSVLVLIVAVACSHLVGSEATSSPISQQASNWQPQAAENLLETYVFVGAAGSGVLISADGFILSNHHVTGETSPQPVRLTNGDAYDARLVGIDPVGDIALLKIDSDEPLPWAPLATADDYQLGMPVFAVGNPFGLGGRDGIPSLSAGTLSTLRVVRGNYADCLQIDAAVNPGNSGGPLLSIDGKLLGINGQIRTRSGMRVNSGIGLAISAEQLAEFIPVLKQTDGGYAHHCAIPEALELSDQDGAIVVSASSDELPLRVGDRLLEINKRTVTSKQTAIGLFLAPVWEVDKQLEVVVQRDGNQVSLQVPVARTSIPGRPWHGLNVRVEHDATWVDPESGEKQRSRQAVIRSVEDDSPAQQAGIEAGELLLAVNDREITSALDVIRAMGDLEVGDYLELQLRGSDGQLRHERILLRPRP